MIIYQYDMINMIIVLCFNIIKYYYVKFYINIIIIIILIDLFCYYFTYFIMYLINM